MVNGLYPLVTIVLSLLLYRRVPGGYNFVGMVLALVAIFLMAFNEVRHTPSASQGTIAHKPARSAAR